MDEKKNDEKDDVKISKLKKSLNEFFTDDIKENFNDIRKDATKGLYRSFAVLVAVPFGWIIFLSIHCFFWSTAFTFYQNLVITFDSLIIAVIVALGLIYKVSGIWNISKRIRALISKLTEKVKNNY
ncbi:MAG: hypothetical protein P8X97_05910 [Candidatus Bathyarchaeota archaeon]